MEMCFAELSTLGDDQRAPLEIPLGVVIFVFAWTHLRHHEGSKTCVPPPISLPLITDLVVLDSDSSAVANLVDAVFVIVVTHRRLTPLDIHGSCR